MNQEIIEKADNVEYSSEMQLGLDEYEFLEPFIFTFKPFRSEEVRPTQSLSVEDKIKANICIAQIIQCRGRTF